MKPADGHRARSSNGDQNGENWKHTVLEAVKLPAGISHLQSQEGAGEALFLQTSHAAAATASGWPVQDTGGLDIKHRSCSSKQHTPEPSRPRLPGYRPGRCEWR